MDVMPDKAVEFHNWGVFEGKLGSMLGGFLDSVAFNVPTLLVTWGVMFVLIVFAIWLSKRLTLVPGRVQWAVEFVVDGFDGIVRESLGEGSRKYLPYVGTVFIFLWAFNMVGVLPFLPEPTRDLNTPLGMGFIVVAVAHISGMRAKGVLRYLREFMEPSFVIGGRTIPNIPMLPLNIAGEFGKAISLPFRLYGNIFGGAMIVLVIGHLILHIGLPVILAGFFGLFIGTVQAFVFSMLALTYTAVAISEDEE